MTGPEPFAPTQYDPDNTLFKKGLPVSLDTERFCLGSVLLNDTLWKSIESVDPRVWSTEANRRIFARMKDIADRHGRIDRVTLADELIKQGQLESIGGLTYLVSLDDGLPEISNIDSYVRIIQDKADLRKLIFNAQKTIDRCMAQEGEPDDIVASAVTGAQEVQHSRQRNDGSLKTTAEVVESFPGGVGAFLDPSQRERGIGTGFTKLDELVDGLKGGEMIILAARPSVGKTAFAMQVAAHVAMKKNAAPVAAFSMEMSSASLLTRLICSIARVDQHRFKTGYLTQDERRKLQVALSEIAESKLYLDDTAALSLQQLATKCRLLKQRSGLGLVVIDYVGLMDAGKGENRNQQVSALSRGLKLMAKELDVPFLVLSQLSRAVETRVGNKRPQLSDLRDSGGLEQDADVVMFLFREEMYTKNREDLKGIAELIVAKQRNGAIGDIPLRFLGQYTRFENRNDDLQYNQ